MATTCLTREARKGIEVERDTAHYWLRQTAELSFGDQRRTLEFAVPVRVGATPDEIARLLDEAEAAMERLSERMDRRVAALRGSAAAPDEPIAPPARPTPITRQAAGIAERRATPDRPAQAPSAPSVASTTTDNTPASAVTAMSRTQFLEQARGVGLLPRQIMERLGVRTLEGLNYAEALEQLKRQLLRESAEPDHAGSSTSASAPSRQATERDVSQPAQPPHEPGADPPRYFVEEDDVEMSFVLPDDESRREGDQDAGVSPPGPAVLTSEEPGATYAPDELDLDDVPDFSGPSLPDRTDVSARRGKSAPDSAMSSGSVPADESRPRPESTTHHSLAQRARARDLLARLRTYQGGTIAGPDQTVPFANVVLDQLGEATVADLANHVWGITPDQLSGQQMRALIQWGKTDAFGAEVIAVLDLPASEVAAASRVKTTGAHAADVRQAPKTTARGAGGSR